MIRTLVILVKSSGKVPKIGSDLHFGDGVGSLQVYRGHCVPKADDPVEIEVTAC